MKEREEFVNLTTACYLLGIDKTTLYRWKDKGAITMHPPIPVRVPMKEIDRILKEQEERRKRVRSNEKGTSN